MTEGRNFVCRERKNGLWNETSILETVDGPMLLFSGNPLGGMHFIPRPVIRPDVGVVMMGLKHHVEHISFLKILCFASTRFGGGRPKVSHGLNKS